MSHRAVFFDGAVCLLWVFACFLYLRLVGFNILIISIGLLSGVLYGAAVALKYIRSIEKNGEFRTTPKMLAFILLTIIIVVLVIIYVSPTLSFEAVIQMVNFIYPVLPAFYAARIIVYLSWERKNARRIVFDGLLVVTAVYAVPELRERQFTA